MARHPCCNHNDLKKGPWAPEEDQRLADHINEHGHACWKTLPKLAGLNRCGKSCRLRWINYLRPDIKRGNFSEEEERVILNLHSVLGNKWSRIATHLPGRTDNEIKNFWNTQIRRKLLKMGIDPKTHKRRTDLTHLFNLSQLLGAGQLGNPITPLDNVFKLQADATQLAEIQLLQNLLQLLNTTTPPNIDITSLLASQNPNPNPIGGQLNMATTFHTMEPALTSHDHFPQTPGNFEAGLGYAGELNISNNGLSSSKSDLQVENPLPELVSASASPESSIVNQIESNASSSNYTSSSPNSSVFDAWLKLMDDETSGLNWQDILDLTSPLSSPISW